MAMQPNSEQASPGTWSDYIYANRQKIAKVDSQRAVFQLTGYRDLSNAGCGLEGPLNGASPGIVGLVIATGDQLVFDFQQSVPSYGGLGLIFTNGDGSGDAVDTNGTGQLLYFDGEADGQWHHMVGSLAKHVGETVAYPLFGTHDWAPLGNFSVSMANAAVVHSNGSVTPIYTGQQASVSAFTGTTCGGQNMTNGTILTQLTDPTMNVSYFVDDHLGTAQMEISGGGWPIWQGQFTPFGLELPDGSTDMEFKFTGKERDTESGLDYFGARYYASGMGRFMSPDWAAKAEPVPYAKLDDPQSLNLYSYVRNNPLSRVDADGHVDCGKWCHFFGNLVTGNFGAAAMALNDGVQRGNYQNAASKLSGPGASAERKALQASTYEKLSPVGKAITDQAKQARTGQLAGKTAEELAESASRTSSAMNAVGSASKVVGAAGVVVAVGAVAVETANAPQGQKMDTALNGGARLGGSFAGAWAGAEVGALGGPWGTLAGGIVGGFGGDSVIKSIQNAPPMDEQTRLGLGGVP